MFHPDNIILWPYKCLQSVIFNIGVKYLPDKDGERYVWENNWFLYFYTRNLLRPYGVGNEKIEPEMIKLLDRCWAVMEGMSTSFIQDPLMRREYYLSFPSLAGYYDLYQGHYTGKFMNSAYVLRKTPLLIDRKYKTLEWLDGIYSYWDNTGLIREIKSKYPYVAALRQGIVLDILTELVLTLSLNKEFSCDHPMIKRLHMEYIDAMSENPERNYFLLYSMKNNKQAKLLYQNSVYGVNGGIANYFIYHHCGMVMPKETYNIIKADDTVYCEMLKKDLVENIFSEELKSISK
jgi:hypothetical protein